MAEYFTMKKGNEIMENVYISVVEAHKKLGWTVVEADSAKAAPKKPGAKDKSDDKSGSEKTEE